MELRGLTPWLPFRQFVVKIHGWCDLACDYCYVYEHVDQSWRRRPRAMSAAVVDATAARIGEHLRRHGVRQARVILHGGEPLLAGPAHLARTVAAVRAAAPADTDIGFTVQTNAVRLGPEFLRLFLDQHVRVGVSLDGGLAAHNRHRRSAAGAESFPRVARALALLGSEPYRPIYGGILCTIDLANDPLEAYRSLLAFEPPMIDLRLPHGNWVHPPPGRHPARTGTPYGDWLVAVFDEWYDAPRRPVAIRLFDSIIQLLLGGASGTEDIGTTRTGAVVIDTDGSIQGSDVLKTTVPGAPETGLDVFSHSFDDALAVPSIRAEQRSAYAVPRACGGCDVLDVCGGGLYAHRFHPTAGFDFRSVYCLDLLRIIRHVRRRVSADLAARRPPSASAPLT
ncbi:FxsB family cyclophane-forming radical SAM/SPASM peptide maturase [Micromonospora echinaurantiaca]|uniref:FxsB family cyclophane-forming radical SAM/SPASM peptide maturase n=1 Tax=Micromonospora echinaurantiaca TaxID=47857 RepID=UPI00371DF111